MRVITNRSTGEMGRLLARAFSKAGAQVKLLEGAVSTELPLADGVVRTKFYFFDELARALKTELRKKPGLVIHAAAVSDFALERKLKGKLPSSDKIILKLAPTKKLIMSFRKTCPNAFIVGFKFEPRLDRKYILEKTWPLFAEAECDLIVANTQAGKNYRAYIVNPDNSVSRMVRSKRDLVSLLIESIENKLKSSGGLLVHS